MDRDERNAADVVDAEPLPSPSRRGGDYWRRGSPVRDSGAPCRSTSWGAVEARITCLTPYRRVTSSRSQLAPRTGRFAGLHSAEADPYRGSRPGGDQAPADRVDAWRSTARRTGSDDQCGLGLSPRALLRSSSLDEATLPGTSSIVLKPHRLSVSAAAAGSSASSTRTERSNRRHAGCEEDIASVVEHIDSDRLGDAREDWSTSTEEGAEARQPTRAQATPPRHVAIILTSSAKQDRCLEHEPATGDAAAARRVWRRPLAGPPTSASPVGRAVSSSA